jgi:predicted alpha/beta hydrolase
MPVTITCMSQRETTPSLRVVPQGPAIDVEFYRSLGENAERRGFEELQC